MYDIVRSPVVTEKSTLGSQHNQVTFRVPLDATKPEIKAAIEGLFKVKVMAVNTLRLDGKTKRFRGRLGKRPDCEESDRDPGRGAADRRDHGGLKRMALKTYKPITPACASW